MGNTALLAIGALDIGGDTVNMKNAGVSLSLSIAGGIVFGQLGCRLGPRR